MGWQIVQKRAGVGVLSAMLLGLTACTGSAPVPPVPSVGIGSSSDSAGSADAPTQPEPDPTGCPPHIPGCPCLFNACDEALVCVDEVCELPFDESTSGSTGTGADTGTDAGDSTTEPIAPPASSSSASDTTSTGEDPTTGTTVEDPCGSAFAGSGHYCGMSIGGESNVLYQCNAAGETVAQHVGAGCPVCVVCPAGFADYCEGGFVPAGSCA